MIKYPPAHKMITSPAASKAKDKHERADNINTVQDLRRDNGNGTRRRDNRADSAGIGAN